MFAITLNEDSRIIRATTETFAEDTDILVAELPEGDINEYKYIDNEYVYEPLPIPPTPTPDPTQLDKVEAQALYTAMLTDTLIQE